MSQFTLYQSTDSGAPVLTGTTGSLIALLDAVLVDGYGGTGSLGWTKIFSGSYDENSSDNKAAYLMPSKSIYMTIMDSAPSYTATSAEAAIRIDEVGIRTAMETPAFSPLGMIRKSGTANSTARPWMLYGDSKTFYMFIDTGEKSGKYVSWMFGEIDSFLPNDRYNVMMIARGGVSSSLNDHSYDYFESMQRYLNESSTYSGSYLARSYYRNNLTSSTSAPIQVGKIGDLHKAEFIMSGHMTYPNPVDGGIYLSPIFIPEYALGNKTIRGTMRGLWQVLHSASLLTVGDTFSGTGDLAGKTFIFAGLYCRYSSMITIETSNTLS